MLFWPFAGLIGNILGYLGPSLLLIGSLLCSLGLIWAVLGSSQNGLIAITRTRITCIAFKFVLRELGLEPKWPRTYTIYLIPPGTT